MNVLELNKQVGDCVLGMPWFKKWNPHIDWSNGTVRVLYKGRQITLKAKSSIYPPGCKEDIQKFLNMCTLRRKLIRNFSLVAAPLIDMVQDENPFHWNEELKDSFEALRSAIT